MATSETRQFFSRWGDQSPLGQYFTLSTETLQYMQGEKVKTRKIPTLTLHGKNSDGDEYTQTFRVGDAAIWDSYNLHYWGTIKAIGARTVTIQTRDGRTKRLDLYKFNLENHGGEKMQEKRRERDANWYD